MKIVFLFFEHTKIKNFILDLCVELLLLHDVDTWLGVERLMSNDQSRRLFIQKNYAYDYTIAKIRCDDTVVAALLCEYSTCMYCMHNTHAHTFYRVHYNIDTIYAPTALQSKQSYKVFINISWILPLLLLFIIGTQWTVRYVSWTTLDVYKIIIIYWWQYIALCTLYILYLRTFNVVWIFLSKFLSFCLFCFPKYENFPLIFLPSLSLSIYLFSRNDHCFFEIL